MIPVAGFWRDLLCWIYVGGVYSMDWVLEGVPARSCLENGWVGILRTTVMT